jgi:hypothetical protein
MAGVSKFPQLSVAKASHGTPVALKGDKIADVALRANHTNAHGRGTRSRACVYTAGRGYRQTISFGAEVCHPLHRWPLSAAISSSGNSRLPRKISRERNKADSSHKADSRDTADKQERNSHRREEGSSHRRADSTHRVLDTHNPGSNVVANQLPQRRLTEAL